MFDNFVGCLQDSNSKVNLFALQSMRDIAPLISEYMHSVMTYTMKAIVANLASKNQDILETAKDVLDVLTDTVGK